MKKTLLLLFATLLIFSIQAQEADSKKTSTYYLIRHAEKKISDNNDPELHEDGVTRAKQWANIFGSIKFDAIYSTDYIRTKETVRPTAERMGMTITLYEPGRIDYEKFLGDTHGKNVLIVGHSNTIPSFVNKIIGKNKYGQIDDDNNGNLYIIEFSNDVITDKLLHIK
jgi:broad specificity phosphatase PhoE